MGFERIDDFVLNAVEDVPDVRDYPYRPALVQLQPRIDPPEGLKILDQGTEGACTGFGLAAVVNLLNARRGVDEPVSARMLYEMAKRFDEWEGEDYAGSSCRGAIRGWHEMGVCLEKSWRYEADDPGDLTVERAKEARTHTPGAYYRVGKRLPDFHAALNEVGVLFASATVHSGWSAEKTCEGEIPFESETIGGHAFAIVGYHERGFWVQNSWGPSWGRDGVALWTYEDWLANIRDAWVVRMSLSIPHIWHFEPVESAGDAALHKDAKKTSAKRAEIAGHFVHVDDGSFDSKGKYWSDLTDVEETAALVAESSKYDHILFYAHGGLNSVRDSARRVRAMKEVWKDNRVYPYHFMWETGLFEEIRDLVAGKKSETEKRVGGATDWTDWVLEKLTRVPGRAIWREMKRGAESPFTAPAPGGRRDGAGSRTLKAFFDALKKDGAQPKKLHLVGHSAGSILLAHLLAALERIDPAAELGTCSLMAPACTLELFKRAYLPRLGAQSGPRLRRLVIYNLTDRLERDDTVAAVYRKSLLYLVSRAFEEEKETPILGMQSFRRNLRLPRGTAVDFYYSDGTQDSRTRTASGSHGGFDNDVATLNDILRRTVGAANVKRPFTAEDLAY